MNRELFINVFFQNYIKPGSVQFLRSNIIIIIIIIIIILLLLLLMNPVAWRLRVTEGCRLSKPIGVKVTDLLHIDDLKVFAASGSKLNRVLKETRGAMQDIGLH